MLSLTAQRRVFDNYKNGNTTKTAKYEYTIEYNPIALIHTWIVRRRKGSNGEYDWLQPLNEEIR